MRYTERVPRRLALIAAAVAALGASASSTSAQGASQDRRPVVAVLDYINASMRTDADYKALSKGISTVLAGRLGETDSIRIVTREKLNEIMSEQNLATSGHVDQEQAVQVGKLLNAHHIIYGTYLVQPNGDTRITASAYSVETSEMEYSSQVRGNADKLQDLVTQLVDKVLKLVGVGAHLRAVLHLRRLDAVRAGRDARVAVGLDEVGAVDDVVGVQQLPDLHRLS